MANIRVIKRRIKSAGNISQMTKAMEMVAASKMKKAQEKAILSKPYAEKIREAVVDLAQRSSIKHHPLLSMGNVDGKYLVVLITTNKGLCGSLNSNLFRKLYKWLDNNKNVDFVTLGKKGSLFAARAKYALVADFSSSSYFQSVPAVNKLIVEGFVNGTYKEVSLFYNTFVNSLIQEPTQKVILPLSKFDIEESESEEDMDKTKYDFIIEPSIDEVLNTLLPHYLENQIRSAIYEAEASEHSARMIAMKNATEAASDLIEGLTLLFNKARQEQITYEIADMVTARSAVE